MLQVTKIFRFETAHAIKDYPGDCCNIHGHSYVLHVTISGMNDETTYLKQPGFIIDFKELKRLVNQAVLQKLDHRLLLSAEYIREHDNPGFENLVIMEAEPTAENLLIFIRDGLQAVLPAQLQLQKLLLFETADSYAEWINTTEIIKAKR